MNLEVDEEWDDNLLWGWELGVLKRAVKRVSEILREVRSYDFQN